MMNISRFNILKAVLRFDKIRINIFIFIFIFHAVLKSQVSYDVTYVVKYKTLDAFDSYQTGYGGELDECIILAQNDANNGLNVRILFDVDDGLVEINRDIYNNTQIIILQPSTILFQGINDNQGLTKVNEGAGFYFGANTNGVVFNFENLKFQNFDYPLHFIGVQANINNCIFQNNYTALLCLMNNSFYNQTINILNCNFLDNFYGVQIFNAGDLNYSANNWDHNLSNNLFSNNVYAIHSTLSNINVQNNNFLFSEVKIADFFTTVVLNNNTFDDINSLNVSHSQSNDYFNIIATNDFGLTTINESNTFNGDILINSQRFYPTKKNYLINLDIKGQISTHNTIIRGCKIQATTPFKPILGQRDEPDILINSAELSGTNLDINYTTNTDFFRDGDVLADVYKSNSNGDLVEHLGYTVLTPYSGSYDFSIITDKLNYGDKIGVAISDYGRYLSSYGTGAGTGEVAYYDLPYIAPNQQAHSLNLINLTANSANISWTNGNGSSRVVFITSSDVGSTPQLQNNTTYTANATFGSGSQVGVWYCVFNGDNTASPEVIIDGLNANTEYRIMVCEYNGQSGSEMYNTSTATGNPLNITTPILPVDYYVIEPTIVGYSYDPATRSGQLDEVLDHAIPDAESGNVVNVYFNVPEGLVEITEGMDTYYIATDATMNFIGLNSNQGIIRVGDPYDNTIDGIDIVNFSATNVNFQFENLIFRDFKDIFDGSDFHCLAIGCEDISVNINNCKFYNNYYAIYNLFSLPNSNANCVISNCIFENNDYGLFFYEPDLSYAKNHIHRFINNTFTNTFALYLWGTDPILESNTFNNVDLYLERNKTIAIEDNTFNGVSSFTLNNGYSSKGFIYPNTFNYTPINYSNIFNGEIYFHVDNVNRHQIGYFINMDFTGQVSGYNNLIRGCKIVTIIPDQPISYTASSGVIPLNITEVKYECNDLTIKYEYPSRIARSNKPVILDVYESNSNGDLLEHLGYALQPINSVDPVFEVKISNIKKPISNRVAGTLSVVQLDDFDESEGTSEADYANVTFITPQQATEIIVSDNPVDNADISWTNGNGDARVVFITSTDLNGVPPVNNTTTYSPTTTFGLGSQAGDWYCIYNGDDANEPEVNVSGLAPQAQYKVMVLEYNGIAGAEQYNTCETDGNSIAFSTGNIPFSYIVTVTNLGDYDAATQRYSLDEILLRAIPDADAGNEVNVFFNAPGLVDVTAQLEALNMAQGELRFSAHPNATVAQGLDGANDFGFEVQSAASEATVEFDGLQFSGYANAAPAIQVSTNGTVLHVDQCEFVNSATAIEIQTSEKVQVKNSAFTDITGACITRGTSLDDASELKFKNNTLTNSLSGSPVGFDIELIEGDDVSISGNTCTGTSTGPYTAISLNKTDCATQASVAIENNGFSNAVLVLSSADASWDVESNQFSGGGYLSLHGACEDDFSIIEANTLELGVQNRGNVFGAIAEGNSLEVHSISPVSIVGEEFFGSILLENDGAVPSKAILRKNIIHSHIQDQPIIRAQTPGDCMQAPIIHSVTISEGILNIEYELTGYNTINGPFVFDVYLSNNNGDLLTSLCDVLVSELEGVQIVSGTVPSELLPQDGDRLALTLTSLGSNDASTCYGTSVAVYGNVTVTDAPGTPLNLEARPYSSSRINLSWEATSTTEESYIIEYSIDSDPYDFIEIAQVNADVNTYGHTGLDAETTYYYRVKARNSIGDDSYYSNIASATTLPATPEGAPVLAANGASSSQILLEWEYGGTGQTGFIIQRSEPEGTFIEVSTLTDPALRAWTDNGLPPGATYEYRIAVTNDNGQSDWSNTATATTFSAYTIWDMDDCTGDLIDDISGVPGILYGAKHAAGYKMHGVSFDGTDDYVLGEPYPFTNDLSVMFWIKASGMEQTIGAGIFASTYTNAPVGSFEINVDNTGSVPVYTFSVTDSDGEHTFLISEAGNEWHHIAVTFSENIFTCYFDGAVIQTYTSASGAIMSDFLLGANRMLTKYFSGSVDNFRVYRSELPGMEIAALYSGSVPNPEICSYESDCLPIVEVEDVEVNYMDIFTVLINTDLIDAECKTISWQCIIEYDSEKLKFLRNSMEGTLTPRGKVNINDDTEGLLRIGAMTTLPIQDKGALMGLVFKAKSTENSQIDIHSFYFNSTVNPNLKNGQVTVNTQSDCLPAVSIDDVTVSVCEMFDVSVQTEEITADCDIISWQFDLEYDHTDLTFIEYDIFRSIAPYAKVTVNEISQDQGKTVLRIGMMTDRPPLIGTGELVNFKFTTKGTKSSELIISDFYFNNRINTNTTNGQVTIEPTASCYPLMSLSDEEITLAEQANVELATEQINEQLGINGGSFDIIYDHHNLSYTAYSISESFLNTPEDNVFFTVDQADPGILHVSFTNSRIINGQGNFVTLQFMPLSCVDSPVLMENVMLGASENTNLKNGSITVSCSAAEKCIASYDFNNCDINYADDLIGDNDMSLINIIKNKGYLKTGLYFNGQDDYAEIPASTNLDITRAISWSFFIKPEQGAVTERYLIGKSGAWTVSLIDNYLSVHIVGAPQQWYSAPGPIGYDVWSHVGITYFGDELVMYINGNKVITFTELPELTDIGAGNPVILGQNPGLPGNNMYLGYLDELKIFHARLTEAEIEALSNVQVAPEVCDPEQPEIPDGPVVVCKSAKSSDYSVPEVELATKYSWILAPASAGEISGNSNEITIYWTNDFEGTAELSVIAMNGDQAGPESESLEITIGAAAAGFNEIEPVLISDGPVTLTAAWPSNGTYSGPGVTAPDQFDPSVAGLGRHIISYTVSGDCPNDVVAGTISVINKTYYAINNGAWNIPANWSFEENGTPCSDNNYPKAGDIAIIRGHSIQVMQQEEVLQLYIEVENSSSRLDIISGNLKVYENSHLRNK